MNTQEQIFHYTGLSIPDQSIICFQAAYEWLDWILPQEPKAKDWMPLNPSFWPWWKSQWQSFDVAFLDSICIEIDGTIKVAVPLSENRSPVNDQNHMELIWRDWHNKRFVSINPDLINKSIQQSILKTAKS